MAQQRRNLKRQTAIAGVSALLGVTASAAEVNRPNILIIVTDDQGYGDLSAFEHHAPDVKTPNMNRLAERGDLFSQAYVTAPVCSPSRAGWNTGRHQVRWDARSSFDCGHPKDVQNIAEIMKAIQAPGGFILHF